MYSAANVLENPSIVHLTDQQINPLTRVLTANGPAADLSGGRDVRQPVINIRDSMNADTAPLSYDIMAS
jgi:hypothetical protein